MLLKKWLLGFMVILTAFVCIGLNDQVSADADLKTWQERLQISPDKRWKVNFNTSIEPESVDANTIYVRDTTTGEKVPVDYNFLNNGETVEIVPLTSSGLYAVDRKYELHIKSGVQAQYGKKMMKTSIILPFNVSKTYQVIQLQTLEDWTLGTSFDSLEEAINYAKTNGQKGIIKNGQIIWAPEGSQLLSSRFANVYDDRALNTARTYVNGGAEFKYIRTLENSIEAELAGRKVYLKHTDVTLIPKSFKQGESYYKNIGGDLHHYIYKNGSYVSYLYGDAPDSLNEGGIVTSWDGKTFAGGEGKFFNELILRKQSHYTGEHLDQYMRSVRPDSPLVGLGDAFVEAEQKYNVNALYLMAHAIHESAWGTSQIARDKNNLYGYKAYDGSAYESAKVFESMEECIDFMAKNVISGEYLNSSSWKHYGNYLGNKAGGMNVKYASDPYWGQKTAGHMYRADKFLGGYDSKLLEEGYVAPEKLAFNESK